MCFCNKLLIRLKMRKHKQKAANDLQKAFPFIDVLDVCSLKIKPSKLCFNLNSCHLTL